MQRFVSIRDSLFKCTEREEVAVVVAAAATEYSGNAP